MQATIQVWKKKTIDVRKHEGLGEIDTEGDGRAREAYFLF